MIENKIFAKEEEKLEELINSRLSDLKIIIDDIIPGELKTINELSSFLYKECERIILSIDNHIKNNYPPHGRPFTLGFRTVSSVSSLLSFKLQFLFSKRRSEFYNLCTIYIENSSMYTDEKPNS